MNSSDPEWYQSLQGNPLRSAAFTEQLKARIRDKAFVSTDRVGKPAARRLTLAGIGLIVAAAIAFYTMSSLGYGTDQERKSAAVPADRFWLDALQAGNPADRTEILVKQRIGDAIMLVLSSRTYEWNDNQQNIELEASEFVEDAGQWVLRQQGSTSIADSQTGVPTGWFELDRIPVFLGIIRDPQIQQIQVIDSDNQVYEGKLIPSQNGNTYWYIYLPEAKGSYKVVGLDKIGNIISSEMYY
ncbi:hypothetical protein [Paenibacillus protaetiae]|uniref:Uncharacterized protein n=1 Tax=Paenibacillus protaetiae TaxID=2509456 RepID=A0A4P6EX95_9BACL|nr:hypothetical protein [Paenibacillus protaetiae]QAY67275.1 hypothetical protein ET464_13560 [Paenibacillus protaetiae]